MMHASITLDKAYAIGQIDPRIYSSFVEHMGRTVYAVSYTHLDVYKRQMVISTKMYSSLRPGKAGRLST